MDKGRNDINFYNHLEREPYYGALIVLVTFMVLGIIGNMHVLLVFIFRMKSTSHRIFIIVLAILDLLSCAVSMPFIMVDIFQRLTFTATTICKIMRFFLYFFAGSSGFLLLPIAVDRYLKTCRPFGEQITPKRAKILCAAILFIGALSFWPAPVLYGHSSVPTAHTNITGVSCYLDDKFKGSLYLAYWNGAMMVMIVGVFFGLIILYFLIGKSIRAHVELKKKLIDGMQANKVSGNLQIYKCNQTIFDAHTTQKKQDKNVESKHHQQKDCVVYRDNLETSQNSNETTVSCENKRYVDITETVEKSTVADPVYSIDNNSKEVTIPVNKSTNDNTNNPENLDENATEIDNSGIGVQTEQFVLEQINKVHHRNQCSSNVETSGKDLKNDIKFYIEEESTVDQDITRKHQAALRKIQRSKRTTQMFFAITILYFITFIPHLILQLITVTEDNFVAGLSFTEQTVYHIVFYCSFLNSMVNCYVYGFFDASFRTELKKVYTCRSCTRRKWNLQTY